MGKDKVEPKRKRSFIRKIWEKLNPRAPTEPPDPGEDVESEGEQESADQADQDKSQHEQVMGAVSLLAAATIGRAPSEMPSISSAPTTPKATRRRSTEQELVQELRTAFELYTKGLSSIPCKEVGYILRTLGQNPTEDEIIALVCEAGCDWDGHFTCDDFLNVAYSSVQKQVNRLDDVRAAFRAFDHNGDGSISKEELKDAMIRFGHVFSAEECDEMFQEADLNADGKIDWEEFLEMMLPGHAHTNFNDEDPTKDTAAISNKLQLDAEKNSSLKREISHVSIESID